MHVPNLHGAVIDSSDMLQEVNTDEPLQVDEVPNSPVDGMFNHCSP